MKCLVDERIVFTDLSDLVGYNPVKLEDDCILMRGNPDDIYMPLKEYYKAKLFLLKGQDYCLQPEIIETIDTFLRKQE